MANQVPNPNRQSRKKLEPGQGEGMTQAGDQLEQAIREGDVRPDESTPKPTSGEKPEDKRDKDSGEKAA